MASLPRRLFFSGGLAASAFGAVSPTPARPQAVAVAAIAAIEAFLALCQAFSHSDGGLGAMLEAQQAKLDLAISQIEKIQVQVAYLAQDVSDLRRELTDQIHEAPVRALANELSAALLGYVELFEGAGGDVAKMRIGDRKTRLEQIETKVWSARLELMTTRDNFGPSSGVMAPAAMGIELSSSIILGRDNAWMRRTVQSYQDWFSSLTDLQSEAAIPAFMTQRRAEVDEQWSGIAQSRLGKQLGYQNGSGTTKTLSLCDILSEQRDVVDYSRCVHWQDIPSNNSDSASSRCNGYAVVRQYSTWSRLQRTLTFSTSADTRVLLDDLKPAEEIRHNKGSSGPPSQPDCALGTSPWLSTDAERDQALRRIDSYVRDDREISAIQVAVERANAAKLRLAYASAVLVSVEQAKAEAARKMEMLGG